MARPKGSDNKKKGEGHPERSKYRLIGKDKDEAKDTPCIARGKHEADCICGGTGFIKSTK